MSKTSYILGKRINRGGMAEIYLGKALGEDNFERICAIKRILPHFASDKEYIKMFRDEAHICKRLQHANIVQVYDFSEVEESFALIMEFIDGADLRTLLSTCETLKVKLPLQMAIYIAACSARGLHYAHTKTDEITGKPLEIIHRDISPQNILISYEGEVKVTDFGIASATAENKSAETKAGVVKGKYSYMSPEQVAAKKLDGRSDVFSLAVVIWEILAMRRLFAGANEIETIRRVQECTIPHKLTELNNEVDDKLMAIIHKGLEADRRKRYQTAAAFDQDLSKYLHTRYPDFGASELGDFLKQKLANRRMETADFIKQTLAISSSAAENRSSKEGKSRDSLEVDETAGAKIKLELSSIDRVASMSQMNTKHGHLTGSKANGTAFNKGNTNAGTMTSRTNAGKKLGVRSFAKGRSDTTILNLLFKVALLILVGFAGMYLFKKYSNTDNLMHVSLRAEPSVVQLELDGKNIKKSGGFNTTPLTLHPSPGKHTLVVSRPGYAPISYEFQGEAGQHFSMDKLYLRRMNDAGVLNIKIKAAGGAYRINLNRGYKTGPTPLIADDIPLGTLQDLRFKEVESKKSYRCSFKTPSVKPTSQIFTVTIKPRPSKSPECKTSFE